jgi:hypothetical protein
MAKDTKTRAAAAPARPQPKGPAATAKGPAATTPGRMDASRPPARPRADAVVEDEGAEDDRPVIRFRLRNDAGPHFDAAAGINAKAGDEVESKEELDVLFPGKFERLQGANRLRAVARPNPANPSVERGAEGPEAPAQTDDTPAAVRGKHKTKSVPVEEELEEETEGESAGTGENLPDDEDGDDEVGAHARGKTSGAAASDEEDDEEAEAESEEEETEDVTSQFRKAEEGDLTVKKHKDGTFSIWEGDDAPERKNLKTKVAVNDALKKMVK